jgi:membrane associated rhomboid family serine protease
MGIYDRPYYQDERRPSYAVDGQSMIIKLIIINAAIFILDAFFFRDNNPYRPSELLSVKPDTLVKPWLWWQFLTYGFCHSPTNTGHILGNMLGLLFLGQEVERHYGSRLFLRMYLTALLLGSVIWAATHLAMGYHQLSLIGASGAVTAAIILFALNFPRRTILFMFFIPMPAWVLGVMIVFFNLWGVRSERPGLELTAFDVHLTGVVYAYLFFRTHWALGWPSSMRLPQLRWPRRQPRLRVHTPDDRQHVLDEQADAVLEKLHRLGQASLTARERKILEEYSRRMQQKRR